MMIDNVTLVAACKSVADALIKDPSAWNQGAYHWPPDGTRCLVGLLSQELKIDSTSVSELLDPWFRGTAEVWNDRPGRTVDSVVRKLRRISKATETSNVARLKANRVS